MRIKIKYNHPKCYMILRDLFPTEIHSPNGSQIHITSRLAGETGVFNPLDLVVLLTKQGLNVIFPREFRMINNPIIEVNHE